MVTEYPVLGQDHRWYKPCPSCGKMQSYLRHNYAVESHKNNKLCKSCANKLPENNAHKGWIKGVLRRSFLNKYKANAELRGLAWELDDDFLADLLIEQDFKCALSNWDLDATDVGNNTASLDRIDSSLGYLEDNVQWVHKMVNMCKQEYSQSDFIRMCKSISEEN